MQGHLPRILGLLAIVAWGGVASAAADAPAGKRDGCTKEVAGKNLRGMDRADAMQICMAEGRLACVKDAVAQKIAVAGRKEFLGRCMGTQSQK